MTRLERTRLENERGGVSTTVILVLGVLAALPLGWWLAVGRGVEAASVDEDRVVTVERRDLIDGVNANGRVEPLARVAVMSRASGLIKELLVEEGDAVKVGQVLAELDREQLEAELAEDRANLASAEARVAASRARLEEARVRALDPEVEFLETEAERQAVLFEKGTTSQSERDQAARLLAAARFRVELVRANLPVLEAAIVEATANLASASAAVERSETGLREATIRCPIDGVVLVRDKEVGDGVSSILTAGGNATQIMTLGDLSRMHVEARVDEVDLGRIRVGMPAIVTVDAHRGRELEARVERIAPAGSVDENGIVTFEVRVAVEDPDGLLRPDMTADAKLVLDRRASALVLPQRAFVQTEAGWAVQRLVPGEGGVQVARTPVELGLSDGLITQVLSGLEEGDRVLLPERAR